MIRKYFRKSSKDNITWRSHEPLRIEAFSDAVFGFALSILIISLEVPKSAHELLESMRGFIPFVFCFAAVILIWFSQYQFFRRYGMHDLTTIILNCCLLFVVLMYVYPLKFMFSAWILPRSVQITAEDVMPLLLVYNGGCAAVYTLFMLMYMNAYAKQEELKLTAIEVFETKSYIYSNIARLTIPLFVILVGTILNHINPQLTFFSLFFYFLFGPVMSILGAKRGKLFHKKFGNVPMIEPHHGTEG